MELFHGDPKMYAKRAFLETHNTSDFKFYWKMIRAQPSTMTSNNILDASIFKYIFSSSPLRCCITAEIQNNCHWRNFFITAFFSSVECKTQLIGNYKKLQFSPIIRSRSTTKSPWLCISSILLFCNAYLSTLEGHVNEGNPTVYFGSQKKIWKFVSGLLYFGSNFHFPT